MVEFCREEVRMIKHSVTFDEFMEHFYDSCEYDNHDNTVLIVYVKHQYQSHMRSYAFDVQLDKGVPTVNIEDTEEVKKLLSSEFNEQER